MEYSDIQCPYCGLFERGTLPDLIKTYVESGKLLLVSKQFPLENVHPLAMGAAEAAVCADRQLKFWGMHDRLFTAPQQLAPSDLAAASAALGLDQKMFQSCLANHETLAQIRNDMDEARSLGMTGTPGFVIGSILGDKVKSLHVVKGAQGVDVFTKVIDETISTKTRH